jgi:hypothetical protein
LVKSNHAGTTETETGDQVLTTRARNLGTNNIDEARRQALVRLPIGRMRTVTDIAKGIVGRCRLDDRRRSRRRRRDHGAVTIEMRRCR